MNTKAPKNSWKANRSYGVILLRKRRESYECLMVCRRNTFCFADFVLGKYQESDLEYMMHLILNMTFTERNLIREGEYRGLWDRVYVKTRKPDGAFYEQAKKKFERSRTNAIYLESKIPCLWKFPEWGFPKGHLNPHESMLDCAKRELFEETSISSSMYTIDQSINPFEEEFIGTNGHKYKNRFYIGFINDTCEPTLNMKNTGQIREISQIRWFPFSTASKIIRFHEHSKQCLLRELESLLNKKNPVMINEGYNHIGIERPVHSSHISGAS
jgi:8-oxo-dGTP pyrophosphatase MutT (NUDIX family)